MTATIAAPKTRRHTVHDPAIGKRLLRARTAAGISQKQLCRDTVFTGAYVSRIENGERTPSLRAIRVWARQLNCSAAWLETGDDVVDVRMSTLAAAELCEWITSNTDEQAWITRPSELLDALLTARGVPEPGPVIGLA